MVKMDRVLLIEDEPELMTILCEMLRRKGYDVIGFSSAVDALKTLWDEEFDILLTDLAIPGMNGIELLNEALKADPNLIVIMMTGQGTLQTALEAMGAGAYDFILKPFGFGTLLSLILRAMEIRRLRNENLQLRDSMALYEVAMAVSATLNTDIILDRIADALLDQCEADEMSVMLLTPLGDELYIAAARGAPHPGAVGKRIPLGQGIAGWVALHHETLMLQGGIHDARFIHHQPRPEIEASVSLPLMSAGKCLGVLNVNSKKRRPFLFAKIKGLTILATVAATALENARLCSGLRASEDRFRRIVETATEGIWILDQNGRTTFVNRRMAEMLAGDPARLAGRALAEFLDDRAGGRNYLDGRHEVRFRRGDGRELWAIVSANPIATPDGRSAGTLAMVTDITDRKRMEKDMARLERLHLVGEMAAGIGHEIRNPITTVRGLLQYMAEKDDCAKHKDHLALMIEELDGANAIITEYLSLAKSRVVELDVQDLNAVVAAVFPLIQSYALLAGQDVRLETGEVPPVLLDRKEIRQLVLNLVRNGLEAMPPRGRLTIRTYTDGRDVVLSVRDEGKGIEPHILDKIGTPFVTTKDHGTGLGLAKCYSTAARHNAVIDIHTGPAGTTFFVRFPSAKPGQ